jgi:hypothetical protein
VAVGHKRCNKEYFKEKYSCKLSVKPDDNISEEEIKINGVVIAKI